MTTSRKRYEISDEEWELVKDLLPSDKLEKQGRPPKPNRDMFNMDRLCDTIQALSKHTVKSISASD